MLEFDFIIFTFFALVLRFIDFQVHRTVVALMLRREDKFLRTTNKFQECFLFSYTTKCHCQMHTNLCNKEILLQTKTIEYEIPFTETEDFSYVARYTCIFITNEIKAN